MVSTLYVPARSTEQGIVRVIQEIWDTAKNNTRIF